MPFIESWATTKTLHRKLRRSFDRPPEPTGYVLWRGPSRIDGVPIVVVMTINSQNIKTSNMVQTRILLDGIDPTEAWRDGRDVSICGDCIHRRDNDRTTSSTCYANPASDYGTRSVYAKLTRSGYPNIANGELRRVLHGRKLRIGTYGDPAAVPTSIWRRCVRYSAGHTGYTHAWRQYRHRGLRNICMASCETRADAALAQSRGWRTFRTTASDAADVQPDEVYCPSAKISCADCGFCDGFRRHRPTTRNVCIVPHGSPVLMHAWRTKFETLTISI